MTAQNTKSSYEPPSPENTSSRRSQSGPVLSTVPATITTQEELPETLGASAEWRCQSWRAGDTKPVHKGFARLGLWEIILRTSSCPMLQRKAENPGMNPGLILLERKPFLCLMKRLTAASNVRAPHQHHLCWQPSRTSQRRRGHSRR